MTTRVAGAGKGLRIPTVTPDIAKLACGPPCTRKATGYFWSRLEPGRFHDIAEDVFVVPALEAELLEFAELALRQHVLVHMGELGGRAAAEAHRIKIGGFSEVAQGVKDLSGTDGESLDFAGDR